MSNLLKSLDLNVSFSVLECIPFPVINKISLYLLSEQKIIISFTFLFASN